MTISQDVAIRLLETAVQYAMKDEYKHWSKRIPYDQQELERINEALEEDDSETWNWCLEDFKNNPDLEQWLKNDRKAFPDDIGPHIFYAKVLIAALLQDFFERQDTNKEWDVFGIDEEVLSGIAKNTDLELKLRPKEQ